MIREKTYGQFYLDTTSLEFIASVASFYKISRSEVVSWAVDASVKSFEKAYKQATKRLYRRVYEKTQKIQAPQGRATKAKKAGEKAQEVRQLVFDFAAGEVTAAPKPNKSIFCRV